MRWSLVRVFVVVATLGALVVPSWATPSRVISIPVTLARTATLPTWDDRGKASFDFRPTHVAFVWDGSAGGRVLYRSVDQSGTAGRWRVAREDPDLAAGHRHFSAVMEVPRPQSVRFKRVEPRAGWMGSVRLIYLNTIDGPRVEETIPSTARAAASTPDVVTRAEWGADESVKRTSGGCTRRFWPVQQLFVHHTAGINNDPHPYATMRAIYYFHVRSRGWCDVGYNFVIGPDGTVFEGRWARNYQPWETHDSEDLDHHGVEGAQVESFNAGSLGISMMGNYSQARPSGAARHALEQVLAWETDRHDLNPLGHHLYKSPQSGITRWLPVIAGHRDAGETACPGSHLYAELPAIRHDVAAIVGEGKDQPALTVERPTTEHYPDDVHVVGSLRDRSTGVGGASITVYARPYHRGWHAEATGVTQADGSFDIPLSLDRRTRVRAVFGGDAADWGAESHDVWVRVAPHVDLQPEGGQPDVAGARHYPNGTSRITFDGSLEPVHPKSYITIRVAQSDAAGKYSPLLSKRVALQQGASFTYTFVVPDPVAGGTYRVTAWFPEDADHIASRSDRVVVTVDKTPVSALGGAVRTPVSALGGSRP